MGSYFEDVYLKRVNREGTTRQDRVKTRKEKEFDKIFLKQSEYRSAIYQINDDSANIVCSLQPNKYNERDYVGNILVSTSNKTFKTGDLVYTRQKIKNEVQEKIWLIVFVDDNITKGYRLYKSIWLNETLSLSDEYGTTQYYVPARIIYSATKENADVFYTSEGQHGYREPNGNKIFVTQYQDFIEKMRYFEYKEQGWEIGGYDNISIDGVCYVTMSKRLRRDVEPVSSKDILVSDDTNFFLNGR